MKTELFQKNFNERHWSLENTSGDMRMLSDLQLVYMVPRNSTQLLNINTTKFQVEHEPVYLILKHCKYMCKRLFLHFPDVKLHHMELDCFH